MHISAPIFPCLLFFSYVLCFSLLLSRRLNGDTLINDLGYDTHRLGEGNNADELVVWNAEMKNTYPVNYAVVVDIDSANAKYQLGIGADIHIYSSWPGLKTQLLLTNTAMFDVSFICVSLFLKAYLHTNIHFTVAAHKKNNLNKRMQYHFS